jgi:peptidoglycan/xylan/chitin deacetylase (PgdA/CDA1 family)
MAAIFHNLIRIPQRRFNKTKLMRRKSGLLIIAVVFLFLLLFPLKANEFPDAVKTPLVTSGTEEGEAAIPEAAAAVIPAPELPKAAASARDAPEEKTSAVPPDTAVVIFTFDDGCISDYELAYPILKKYGIRGTSYIIPEYQDTGRPYALTWDMVKEMKQYGWVFGCHTYAHSDLTKMTADEIRASMLKVNESFMAQGLDAPAIHAFPFGRYDQKVIDAMKPFRVQMRKAFYESKFVDPKTADPYGIDSCSADMRMEERLKLHEAFVDKAVEQKAIIVFRCHCLYKESVGDMGNWTVQTDSRLFEKLVRYCADKGCRFMTMTDLLSMCADVQGL